MSLINISLFFNSENENAVLHARTVIRLSQYISFIKIFMHKDFKREFNSSNIYFKDTNEETINNSEIAIIIGGDGTILKYSKLASKRDVKVLGINSGKLGFIAGIESGEIESIFIKLLSKKYFIDSRMLISTRTGENEEHCALNDVVLVKGTDSQVINYSIYKNNNSVCNYYADGIIIATPTGSTAYSLSAGGPIVDSTLNCFVITPICAHSLTARPLILDTDKDIKIDYDIRNLSELSVIVDGQKVLNSQKTGSIVIKKHDKFIDFIVFKSKNNYKDIDKKLIQKALH